MSQHTCIHTSNHSSPYNATHGYIMPRADLGTQKYQKKGPLCRGSIRHGPPDSSLAGANRVGHTRTQSTRTRTSTHANAHASTHACSQLCLRVLLPRHCGDIPQLLMESNRFLAHDVKPVQKYYPLPRYQTVSESSNDVQWTNGQWSMDTTKQMGHPSACCRT